MLNFNKDSKRTVAFFQGKMTYSAMTIDSAGLRCSHSRMALTSVHRARKLIGYISTDGSVLSRRFVFRKKHIEL